MIGTVKRRPNRMVGLPFVVRRRLFLCFKYTVISIFVLVSILPLVWMVLSSFKTNAEFSLSPAYALPEQFGLDNFATALTRGNIGRYFVNTLVVVLPSILIVITLCVTAAFALEVIRWKGASRVYLFLIAGIFVPPQLALLPLYSIYSTTGLLDTPWSLIVTYTAFTIPFAIFLTVGYFKAVPRQLMEAALVDGASIYQAFLKVALPLMRNALITVALLQFIWMWNDLLFSLTFIRETNARTIQSGLLNFTDEWGRREWGPTFAGITLTVLPVLVVYLLLNKRIIKGFTQGGLKG